MNESIALLSSKDLPAGGPDTENIISALDGLGIHGKVVAWDGADIDWSAFGLLVLVSPWDYSARLPAFLSWVDQLPDRRRLLNQEHLDWNIDKRYLLELEHHGIPIPPTLVVCPDDLVDASLILAAIGSGKVVTKPIVGAGGRDIFLHEHATAAAIHLFTNPIVEPVLLQSFDRRVLTHGEYSLIFLAGQFSHAASKVPRKGEFRVQPEWGGQVVPLLEPPKDLIAISEAVLATIGKPNAYARIDLLAGGSQPSVVMEVELIEPDLFLRYTPEAFDRYAEILSSTLLESYQLNKTDQLPIV